MKKGHLQLLFVSFFMSCQTPTSVHFIPDTSSLNDYSSDSFFLKNMDNSNSEDWTIQMLRGWQKTDWKYVGANVVQIIDNYSNNTKVCELGIDYYLSIGDLDNARFLSEKGIDIGCQSAQFYHMQASIAVRENKSDLALDYINKAIMINVKDAKMHARKGNVYLDFGDSISALKYLEKAFLMDEELSDIGWAIASIQFKMRKYDLAEKTVKKLIVQDSLNEGYQFLLAEIYFSSNKEAKAIGLFKTMLKSENLQAGDYLMEYYEKINMLDSCYYIADRLLSLDSLWVSALNHKAKVFDKRGYFPSALMYYEKTLTVDSLNEEARLGVSKVAGKIAYLRNIKEQREAMPIMEFAVPKKMKVSTNE